MIFFAEKMWFFQQKILAYLRINVNLYKSLTNDVVSFELGPDKLSWMKSEMQSYIIRETIKTWHAA